MGAEHTHSTDQPGAMSYVGSVGANGSATSYTMTLPTVADHDVLFLFVSHTNTVVLGAITPAMDGGTTPRLSVTESALVTDVFTRNLAASDSGTTLTVPTTSGASKTSIVGIILRGVDTSDPMPTGTTTNAHDATSSRTTPAVTVAETTDIITFVSQRLSAGTSTSLDAPAGVTKVQQQINAASGQNDSAVGYVAGVAAGTVGPYAWGFTSGTTARRIGITIGVNAIGGGTPVPTMSYLDASGTLVPVYSIQYLDATGTLVNVSSFNVV
jgi:hypothetical protein